MSKIKTLMITTNTALSEHFVYAMSHSKNIRVLDVVTNGYGGVLEASLLKPDIIIITYNLEAPSSGALAANALLSRFSNFKIIMVCDSLDDKAKVLLFNMGVYDILPENAGADEILKSIHKTNSMTAPDYNHLPSNHSYKNRFTNDVKDSLMYTLNIVSQLKPRELEITKLLVDNLSFEEIAYTRNSDVDTIIDETNEILKKFNKETVNELIQVLHALNITEFLENIV